MHFFVKHPKMVSFLLFMLKFRQTKICFENGRVLSIIKQLNKPIFSHPQIKNPFGTKAPVKTAFCPLQPVFVAKEPEKLLCITCTIFEKLISTKFNSSFDNASLQLVLNLLQHLGLFT